MTLLLASIHILALSSSRFSVGQGLGEIQVLDPSFQAAVSGHHNPFSSYAPSQAIRALRLQVALEADIRRRQSLLERQVDRARKHQLNAYSTFLATMTSEERKWLLERDWKQAGLSLSDAVETAVPMVTHGLSNLGDPTDRKIFDILKMEIDEWERPIRDTYAWLQLLENMSADPAQTLQLAKLKIAIAVYNKDSAVGLVKIPSDPDLVLLSDLQQHLDSSFQQIRTLLTGAQQDEWNSVIWNHRRRGDQIDHRSSFQPRFLATRPHWTRK